MLTAQPGVHMSDANIHDGHDLNLLFLELSYEFNE